MTGPNIPTRIFHITHVDNLASIFCHGGLLSDAEMRSGVGPRVPVGMTEIKQRRMGLAVKCHPGDLVGEYVPFYFCPRSIMLYLLHMGNHAELSYHGGQNPILHLEADLGATVSWAEATGARWAFSLSNAGSAYAAFRSSLADLADIDWAAIANPDFRSASVKEGKQAEFLVQRFVPWHLVQSVGVNTAGTRTRVLAALEGAVHQPPVDVLPDWYF